jgi:hypothetical protein
MGIERCVPLESGKLNALKKYFCLNRRKMTGGLVGWLGGLSKIDSRSYQFRRMVVENNFPCQE